MIQIDKVKEIGNIEGVTIRSQRILDEIQPEIRGIIDRFVQEYGEKDPFLRQLKVHTYETTLRTTITDSKNPKYAERVRNLGRKAFVELIDEQLYEAPIVILRFEINLLSEEIRIAMPTDFYPFMVYSKKSQLRLLEQMVTELDSELEVFTNDDPKAVIQQENLIEAIFNYKENKRKPTLCFGRSIPFNTAEQIDDLLELIWTLYNKLTPVRKFIADEAKLHSEAMYFLDNFRRSFDHLNINLFSKTYKVEFEQELKRSKTNEYRQLFTIKDNDQLITTGYFVYFYREPKEVIGIKINNRGLIYTNVREIANTKTVEWYNKKSFYQRGKYNENNENQKYQEKSVLELKNHGFDLDSSGAFYVGTYNGEKHAFTEPIAKIQERLITASAIFADIIGIMTFPKPDNVTATDEEGDEVVIEYSSTFDFKTILELVEQSGLTFSLEIVRDFYLNLTSLDDKHFVILNGISGTGKTQLSKVFANAVYELDYTEDNPYLKIIPVRPDWTDGTSLFGYYSSFEKQYMKTEFLEMLLQANNEKDKPHFVVLDEMNLARVEYYLSDYLSGVESRKPIHLHNVDEVTDVPRTIEIPHNFYLIGTINTDETTYSLSDKVLDRAFVMTLSDVDFESFYKELDVKLKESLSEEWRFLIHLHEVLVEYDLHFGYRTMNETLRKLYKNSQLHEDIRMDKNIAIDRVVSEKILPKIKGDERIDSLLVKLESMFNNRFGNNSDSLKHIVRMRKELERYGATQFWR